jgi:hypothetical protein
MMRVKRRILLSVLLFSIIVPVLSATASTYTGGTGDLVSSAVFLPGGTDKITDSLGPDAAHLYGFYWNGGSFSAYTAPAAVDNSLFLFDSAGRGLWACGDVSGSDVSARIDVPNLAAGSYYLGVTFYNLVPVDDSYIPLFPWIGYPVVGQVPVDSSASAIPLSAWYDPQGSGSGSYEINFTSPTAVPIPAAAWLLGSGLIGLVVLKRKPRR